MSTNTLLCGITLRLPGCALAIAFTSGNVSPQHEVGSEEIRQRTLTCTAVTPVAQGNTVDQVHRVLNRNDDATLVIGRSARSVLRILEV